jgi:hypothetical protein
MVGSGLGPNSVIFGEQKADKFVTHGEWSTPIQCIAGGTSIDIVPTASFMDASLANGEMECIVGLAQVTYNGDAGCVNGACDANFLRKACGRNYSGTFYRPTGATGDAVMDQEVGSALSGSTDTIFWNGSKLVQRVYCSAPCCITTSGSYDRIADPRGTAISDSGTPVDAGTDTGPGDTAGLPTLTALANPLMAPAAVTLNTPTLTLQGTNLATVTGVTVGGSAATAVSSTSTSVTFRVPNGLTPSATPYNVVVTNAVGSGTLPSAIYVDDLAYGWSCTQGYSGGVWTDFVAGKTASVTIAGFTAPDYVTSSYNGHCSLVFNGTQALSTAAATLPSNTVGALDTVFTVATANPTNNFLVGGDWAEYGLTSGSMRLNAGTDLSTSWVNTGIPRRLYGVVNGASSSVQLDNATATSGNAGSTALTTITIGSRSDGNATLTQSALKGYIPFVGIRTTVPTSGQIAVDDGITNAIWGAPGGTGGITDGGLSDSGSSDSGTDAGTDSGADAGPPPTLTAVNDSLFTGTTTTTSTPNITLAGTNLTTGCSVTVGGLSATNVTCSGTSVSFRPPTGLTESSTAYSVVATTAAGSATLNKGMYAANWCHGWHPAQGYSAGTATDFVAGVTATHLASGFTSPGTTTSFGSTHTAWTLSGTQSLSTAANAITEAPTAGSFMVIFEHTTVNQYNFYSSNGFASAANTSWASYLMNTGIAHIAAPTDMSAGTFTNTLAPHLFHAVFNNTSSQFLYDHTAAHTGTAGTNVLHDITIGSRYDGNATITSGLVGDIGFFAVRCSAPTSGQITVEQTIATNEWSVP